MKLELWVSVKRVELKPGSVDSKAPTAAAAAAILAWEIKARKHQKKCIELKHPKTC